MSKIKDFVKDRPMPAYSTIIGRVADQQRDPFLLDLTDPMPGSILFTSELDMTRASIRLMAEAATTISPASQVQVTIIADDLGRYNDLPIIGIEVYKDAAMARIYELAQVANQRRSGRERGAIHLLFLEDIRAVWKARDMYTESQLLWLLGNGPQSGIWPVAYCRAAHLPHVPRMVLELFKTHVQQVGQVYRFIFGSGYFNIHPSLDAADPKPVRRAVSRREISG